MSPLESTHPSMDRPVTLAERAGEGYTARVVGPEDRMEGHLTIERHEAGGPIPPAAILEFLRGTSLRLIGALEERVAQALSSGDLPAPLKVAEGVAPKKGKPARIDWKIDLTHRKVEHQPEEKESVKFREFAYIPQAKEEEILFVVIPPTRGAAGVTADGQEVEGLLGDPPAVEFGEGVRLDAGTHECRATGRGHVRFESGRVWVSPVYRVAADVDFATGNIDFDGEVHVDGNVQDGFIVRATGKITIDKSVYAGTVEAGGDIVIHEGATGHEKGILTAGGRVVAKYLNGVTVRARGDIEISSEVVNSELRTKGKLLVPRGNIYGGVVVAVNGIEARQLGSPTQIPTRVTVGIDPDVEKQGQTTQTHLKQCDAEMERIERSIRTYLQSPEQVASLPPEKRDLVRDQLGQLLELRKRRRGLEAEFESLDAEPPSQDPVISVLKVIYPKVTLSISRCTTVYSSEARGPMTLVADTSKGKIRSR